MVRLRHMTSTYNMSFFGWKHSHYIVLQHLKFAAVSEATWKINGTRWYSNIGIQDTETPGIQAIIQTPGMRYKSAI